jgi:oligopeptide/dipeptide ABC transporter ATP-binding protein
MTALLTVEGLRLGFRTDHGLARVLDGVDLAIEPGRVMGLVGESGCGKTTLARAILGVLPRTSTVVEGGAIRFQGRDMLADDPAIARDVRGRRVTFVPQDPFQSLNPLFTIGTQVADLQRWKSPHRDRPRRERIAADAADLTEVLAAVQLPPTDQLLPKYPHQLSGGQRQRLMIAMALLPAPDLIVADEPTTALDVSIQEQVLFVLKRLTRARGVAVLLTTHDLGVAWELCHAITVMYAGQIVEQAPVERFFAAPRHPYTRALLASRPTGRGLPAGIPGEVPAPTAPPGGCRFHPRCAEAVAACAASRPGPSHTAPAQRVHCHRIAA